MKRLDNLRSMDELLKLTENKNCFCFGAGRQLTEICNDIPTLSEHIEGIIDNNPALWGTKREVRGQYITIYSVEELLQRDVQKMILLITCSFKEEIIMQLEQIEVLKLLEYIDFQEIFDTAAWGCICPPQGFRKNKIETIPRKIHYCWFSVNKMPERLRQYVECWRTLCPDYEIILWNEDNYDISKSEYMYEAYKKQKWSFVTDYARLDIVYTNGGIYMDTDVEMIRRPDELLFNDAYIGFERLSTVNTGSGFGAKKGFPILKEIMDFYDGRKFINEEDPNKMILCPTYETEILKKHGLRLNGNFQIVDDMTVYPVKYFNAKSLYSNKLKITDETISVHHCTWTWAGEKNKL